MRILRHAVPGGPSTAIAIGSFDGVHLGHATILANVMDESRRRALEPAVLTFEPLPREFFAPESAPPRLTTLAERLEEIGRPNRSTNATRVPRRFGRRFASISPEAFCVRLRECYGARWVMVGPDFRFGAGRGGDTSLLQTMGPRLGYEVAVVPPVMAGDTPVSSTRVRDALARADFPQAASLLGRPYTITGRVMHGAKRGRALGFPTANVRLARRKPPLTGIFAVKCYGAATRGLEGVASLGLNPAVSTQGRATLEAFLFDFSGDLYGSRLTIEFLKKLRDEAPFASLDELAAQIRRDCDDAREFFRAMPQGA